MNLLFDHDEYRARVARTQAAMRIRGIDVLLVSNPANQFYLTGYDGWSFYTPQMVVVSVDAEEPFEVHPVLDVAVGGRREPGRYAAEHDGDGVAREEVGGGGYPDDAEAGVWRELSRREDLHEGRGEGRP